MSFAAIGRNRENSYGLHGHHCQAPSDRRGTSAHDTAVLGISMTSGGTAGSKSWRSILAVICTFQIGSTISLASFRFA